jgi:hypothetical protein
MNPETVRDSYRRAIDENGEIVTIRRYGPNRQKFDVAVRARVVGFSPSELVGVVQQGDRRVVILAEDLINAQFAIPIKASDKCEVRGVECAIIAPDDSTRRLGTNLIAYDLVIRG